MKIKYILSGVLLTAVNLIFAQDATMSTSSEEKISFGLYGGGNFQNINGKNDLGEKLKNSLVPKFHVGANIEIPVAPEFYFQAGLQFIAKGTKGDVTYTDAIKSQEITRELKMNYLEVPLHFLYKPMLGEGHLILGFGPYIGYSFGGKAIFTGNSTPPDANVKYVKDVPAGYENNLTYFKHMDAGADFFVGYQLRNGINFTLNSQLGLININSNTSSKLANKNTGFGLSVGYRF